MSTIEIREELHKYIDSSEDEIIAAVFELFKSYNSIPKENLDEIDKYNQEINDAMAEYNKGNYTLHEDVKKELGQI